MATIRIAGFGTVFELEDSKVGIGTDAATHTLQALGNIRSEAATDIGISSLSTYQGFVDEKARFTTGQIDNQSQSGSTSGEIVIDGDVTVSSATTFTSGPQHLTVTDTFTLPSGDTNSRELKPTPGSLRFNQDFATLEFYTGNNWATVNTFTEMQNSPGNRGRGLFGGGQPGSSSRIDSIEIMSQGNGVDFGSLINSSANKMAYANSVRGIFVGGSSNGTDMDYVTIASKGNGIDFGNLTQDRGYGGGASSSTRGVAMGGWAGSNPPSNVIDYVEIMTIGNALDFGDLFTGRYNHSSFSSPTRAFAYSGVNNNNGTGEASIEMITIASKGNGTDFGDAAARANATLCGSSSRTRGIMAGGTSGPTYLNHIQYLTMSSSGSAQIFGDLTSARQRPGGASTHTRSVFYGGRQSSGSNYSFIDFITIATTGNAQDFGDVNDRDNYTKAGCSDSHGGLGGY
jgi:hypothetical protein